MNIDEIASKRLVPRRRHRDKGVTGHLSDDEESMDGVRSSMALLAYLFGRPCDTFPMVDVVWSVSMAKPPKAFATRRPGEASTVGTWRMLAKPANEKI